MESSGQSNDQPSLAPGPLELAEIERLQMSCELHDGLLQQVIAARWLVESLAQRLAQEPISGADLQVSLGEVEELLSQAVRVGRNWIGELRGSNDWPRINVGQSLLRVAEEARKQWPGFQIRTDVDPSMDQVEFPAGVQVAIVRIAQESIRNACRHSRGSEVILSAEIDPTEGRLNLEVRDDGCGFDPNSLPADHFGVLGMRTRANLIGARLRIESKPKRGTLIGLVTDKIGKTDDG